MYESQGRTAIKTATNIRWFQAAGPRSNNSPALICLRSIRVWGFRSIRWPRRSVEWGRRRSIVLRALTDAGLMDRTEVPKRGRGRCTMALTEAGEKLLADHWGNSLDAKREMESILRGTAVESLLRHQPAIPFL